MKNNKLIFLYNLVIVNVPTIIAIFFSTFSQGEFINATMLVIYAIYCVAMVYPFGTLCFKLSNNKLINLISLSIGAIVFILIVIFSDMTNVIGAFFGNVSGAAVMGIISLFKNTLSDSVVDVLVRLFQILFVVFPYCMCGVGIKIQSSW